MEPLPIGIESPWRLLAWPRYEAQELELLFTRYLQVLTQPGVCLYLALDPQVDGEPQAAVEVLQQTGARVLGSDAELTVQLFTPVPSQGDLPRLGQRMHCILELPSSQDSPRSTLFEATGLRRLDSTELVEEVLARHGPLLPADISLDEVVESLRDSAWLALFAPPGQQAQRFEIRPAVRFLRRVLEGVPEPELRLAIMEELGQRFPTSRPILVAWAEVLLAQDQPRLAAEKAREALSHYYDDVETQRLFLRCVGETDRFEDAGDCFCSRPFEEFQVYDDGKVYLCNITWIPVAVGNAFEQSVDEIWASPVARAIRESVLDGSFRFCSPMTCARRFRLPRKADHPERHAELVAAGPAAEGLRPTRIGGYYDRSCNLTCPSCRRERIMANRGQQKKLDDMAERVILPLMAEARHAYITGSGDALGSPHFRRLLGRIHGPEYEGCELHLMTNGVLLNDKVWEEISPLAPRIEQLTVSIDGAEPETYERLRRGARWPRLVAAMELLAGKRRAGELRRLNINFVVQEDNYLQMRPLIELARGWAVDQVLFFRLRTWGSFTADEFKAKDIVNPLHPRHTELLAELAHPIFREPIVGMWDLSDLIDKVASEAP